MTIETLLTPAELPALARRDLRATTCVVFDILRATSTFVTALHHGAAAIVPVSEIASAVARQQQQPDVLLAGERAGLRLRAAQTGGRDFDFGNSPREFTPEKVRGRTIVSTTTNGTRALQACAGAKMVLAAAFLNLAATAEFLRGEPELLLVCAGTGEEMAAEDVLAAGALADWLVTVSGNPNQAGRAVPCPPLSANERDRFHHDGAHGVTRPTLSEATESARQKYQQAQPDLAAAIRDSQNGRRLLAMPELRDDVAFCAQRDLFNLVAVRHTDGSLRRH